jgi:hypothetical protein
MQNEITINDIAKMIAESLAEIELETPTQIEEKEKGGCE